MASIQSSKLFDSFSTVAIATTALSALLRINEKWASSRVGKSSTKRLRTSFFGPDEIGLDDNEALADGTCLFIWFLLNKIVSAVHCFSPENFPQKKDWTETT